MNGLPDIKIGQLRNFVAVVDHHGFKAAARILFRTQPAISQSIKELENLIGVPLFERNTQSELTPFGKQFYVSARRLIDHYNSTIRGVIDRAHVESGEVRVAIIPSVARAVLPLVLANFTAAHPKIEIWIEDGDAAYVRERVSSGNVDFGCSATAIEGSRITFTGIVSDVMGVVCSIKHPLAKTSEVYWNQLHDCHLISNGAMSLLDPSLGEPLQRLARLHISNITSLLALVEANIGVTVLPKLAFPESSIHSCFVPLAAPVAERTIGILQLDGVSLTPAAEAFQALFIQGLIGLR